MSRQITQVNQLQVYQLYLVGRGEQPWQSRDSCSQGSFSRPIKLHCDGHYMLAKLMMVSKQNILLLRRQDCCRWLDKSACWSHKFQCVVVRGDRVVMKSHFHFPSKVLQYAKSLCGSLCCSCNELIFSLLSFWCTGYLLIHFKLFPGVSSDDCSMGRLCMSAEPLKGFLKYHLLHHLKYMMTIVGKP